MREYTQCYRGGPSYGLAVPADWIVLAALGVITGERACRLDRLGRVRHGLPPPRLAASHVPVVAAVRLG
eukprot:scaffold20215_cov59-Phaeocystis_antarctica.AAC.1